MRCRLVTLALAGLVALTGCTSSTDGHPVASGSASGGQDISFVVDGTRTYGTLDVPAHPAGRRLAAALLLPGSGPADRNGNEPAAGITPNTLKVIADLLADRGIITLRFDKYFTGETGAGKYAADPSSATVQGDLRQAAAAYGFLARQPEVDPAKLLVVGHSEGGMIALDTATSESTSGAKPPAGLALLEPQDLPALDLVRIQTDEYIDAFAAHGSLTAAQARTNKALVARAIGQFRAGQTVSTTGMAAAVVQLVTPEILNPRSAAYVRSWDEIVPVDLAATVRRGTQVLVTDGTADAKVPPSTITPLVQALRSAGTTGPGLVVLQGTDHLMHLPSQPANAAVLAPSAVSAIANWAQPFASS